MGVMRLRGVGVLFAFALVAPLTGAQYAFWTRGIPFTVELGRDGWVRPTASVNAPGMGGPLSLDFSSVRRRGDGLHGTLRVTSAGHSLHGLRLDILGASEVTGQGERALGAAATPRLLGDAATSGATITVRGFEVRNTPFRADTRTIVISGIVSGWSAGPDVPVQGRIEGACLNEGRDEWLRLGAWRLWPEDGRVSRREGPDGLTANSLDEGEWVVSADGIARLYDGTVVAETALGSVRRQRQIRSDANGSLLAASDDGIARKVRRDGSVEWQVDLKAQGPISLSAGAKGRVYALRQQGRVAEVVAIEDNGATVRSVTRSNAKGPIRIERPVALRTDPTGYLYVLESRRGSFDVLAFDPFGGAIRQTRHAARDSHEPLDLAFGEDGRMFVLFKDGTGNLFVRTYRPF